MQKPKSYNSSKNGIQFDSGTLAPKDQACPHCGSDFEYILVLERKCKKHDCHDGNKTQQIKSVVLKPGTLLVNQIGIRPE